MSTSGKIVFSVGVASSALLAAWLFSGDRKERTRDFVVKKAKGMKSTLKAGKFVADDQMEYYL